jgi:iron complex transport system permease protein
MRPHAPRTLALLAIGLGAIIVVAVGRGAVALSLPDVVGALLDPIIGSSDDQHVAIVWNVRLPRVLLAALVGASLASAGAALQAIVRNPLADATLIGVSGGAALGAVAAIVLGASALTHATLGPWLVPAAAFTGALVATRIALVLARVDGTTSGVTLLLAGVGLAALTGAAIGMLVYLADDAALRSITFWNLGSVGSATWLLLMSVALPIGAGLFLLPRLTSDLDRLALGESEARHVGVDVERTIRRVTLLTSLSVGAAVAVCGTIGFVGLVVPYLARAVVGPGHRALLPACALGGAILLVLADLVARTVAAPTEIPLGVVTALAGAPVLLALLRRGRAGTVLP